jgi:hypothetical protein
MLETSNQLARSPIYCIVTIVTCQTYINYTFALTNEYTKYLWHSYGKQNYEARIWINRKPREAA